MTIIKGVKRLFKSVWHARALKPELDATVASHGKRYEQQVDLVKLRRKWPKFRKSKERRKKVRAARERQAAAKRMCGFLQCTTSWPDGAVQRTDKDAS
jgi:hypothetical protein